MPYDAPIRTRDEQLAWAKARAQEYLDANDPTNAWFSFSSDLNKHPETSRHAGLQLGMALLMTKNIDTTAKMREHINGCN